MCTCARPYGRVGRCGFGGWGVIAGHTQAEPTRGRLGKGQGGVVETSIVVHRRMSLGSSVGIIQGTDYSLVQRYGEKPIPHARVERSIC
jgi:hypothetical protein